MNIKLFLNIQVVRPDDKQSANARYINITLKISLYLVCFLLFSYEALSKCRENYGNSFGVVYRINDVTAKIVVSILYICTMNMHDSLVHIKLGLI